MDIYNIQQQSDLPFLLYATPGEAARMLNRAASIDDIDVARDGIAKSLNRINAGMKYDEKHSQTIDDSKAIFIQNRFKNYKIAIFYNFIQEFKMLKEVFGNKLTNDLNEFNNSDKWIALQIVSGREGISLSKADYLVFLNIQFSAVSFWQSRDRLTTMERKSNEIFWIFAENGIEEKIYKRVLDKKDFTLDCFKKEFKIK